MVDVCAKMIYNVCMVRRTTVILSDVMEQQIADLERWWGERTAIAVLSRCVERAWQETRREMETRELDDEDDTRRD